MSRRRTVHGVPERRARRRRRAAAGGLAFAISAVGGLGTPASAQSLEPTVVFSCANRGGGPELEGGVRIFPPDEEFRVLQSITGHNQNITGEFDITTDSQGNWDFGPFGFVLVPPYRIGFAAFRDTNQNGVWDPDSDDNVYRGSGVVECNGIDVELTPK